MKIKSLLLLVVGTLGFGAMSASADSVVNTSSCSWNLVYSQSGAVAVYNSVCTAAGIPTITKTVTNNGTSCAYGVNNSNYYLTNTSCSGYSLYQKDAVSSSSQASSSQASSVSACQASGKAGKFVTSGSSSGVVGAAQQAAAYCSPQCGTYSTTADSYTYKFYCSLQ